MRVSKCLAVHNEQIAFWVRTHEVGLCLSLGPEMFTHCLSIPTWQALSITKGDTEKAARLLIDFKGRTSKDLAKVADMDPNCIVCYGADKDIAIEPCGHLICHKCFDKIRQSASSMQQTCPYCRAPITGARPALLKGNDTMAEVETEFGTLTCLSDEEEEEEVVNLSEARRQSVKSTKS